MGLQADMRDAAISLVDDYAASVSMSLTSYRARPASIHPPHAFVDRMTETLANLGTGAALFQRTPLIEVVVLFGLFDSGEAVDQKDAFVDGFLAWTFTRYHEAGANTLIAPVSVEDEPTFVNEWMKPELQRTYFGVRITLEGYAQG